MSHQSDRKSSTKRPCIKFLSGKCPHDASSCHYSHVKSANPTPPIRLNTVCLFHLKGKCHRGDSCWFIHSKEIRHWLVEWFTEKVCFLFNEDTKGDGNHSVREFAKIEEELNFLIACFRNKKAAITNLHINFQSLNFANAFIFTLNGCKSIVEIPNLQSLQLSIGGFGLLLSKTDEIDLVLKKAIKLKSLCITDLNKLTFCMEKKRPPLIFRFISLLKESFLDFFEIEVIRPPAAYDQTLKSYLFIISALMDSQINFLKFSLNQDLIFLINTTKSKIVFTINFNSTMQIKRLMQDFWDGAINPACFLEVSFNFVSEWFSGLYTHEVVIHNITNLTYLELDFKRININLESMELLWKDLKKLRFLSHLNLYFPNVYVDPNILSSLREYLANGPQFLKFFILKIKIMFISEEEVKDFLIVLTGLEYLQNIELQMDLNMLQLWAEDIERGKFFDLFVRKLLTKEKNLMNFIYCDRSIKFQLNGFLEKWLLLKRMLVHHILFTKREKLQKHFRKEIIYDLFRRIISKEIKKIKTGLMRKEPLFSCLDLSENESEGAFYERFLQI